MHCPFCNYEDHKVVDSRSAQEGKAIRRRRECLGCQKRFTTYETIEQTPLKVIKRDKRREDYDRTKILNGVLRACEKRPVSMEQIEKLVGEVEKEIAKDNEQEVASTTIGKYVMTRMQKIDEVAYVRFASVYRQFKDATQFMREVKRVKGLVGAPNDK
jgi:transcriptional repressor NrdR